MRDHPPDSGRPGMVYTYVPVLVDVAHRHGRQVVEDIEVFDGDILLAEGVHDLADGGAHHLFRKTAATAHLRQKKLHRPRRIGGALGFKVPNGALYCAAPLRLTLTEAICLSALLARISCSSLEGVARPRGPLGVQTSEKKYRSP
jgi:hypothetical protein